MSDPSRELVERATRGDGVAIDSLLERYLPDLCDFVRHRAGAALAQKESASDLVQSACREVLQHMDRFRYDGEDGFRRWLFATTLRKIQDRHRYWRAERRRAEREVRQGSASGDGRKDDGDWLRTLSTPSRHAAANEELERVQQALAALPEPYRQVIRLHHLEGRSHEEIARELSVSEAYARTILSRGLARLARVLHRG